MVKTRPMVKPLRAKREAGKIQQIRRLLKTPRKLRLAPRKLRLAPRKRIQKNN